MVPIYVGIVLSVAWFLYRRWRKRRTDIPIYATGIWREARSQDMLSKLGKMGWDIQVLPQNSEGRMEAASVAWMMEKLGHDLSTGAILIGTGKGSTQIVALVSGQVVGIEAGPGYKENSPEDIARRGLAVARALDILYRSGGLPTCVVAWGSCWYTCKAARDPVPLSRNTHGSLYEEAFAVGIMEGNGTPPLSCEATVFIAQV